MSLAFLLIRYPKFKVFARRKLGKLESELIEQVVSVGSFSVTEAVEFIVALSGDYAQGLMNTESRDESQLAKKEISVAFSRLVAEGYLERVVNFRIAEPEAGKRKAAVEGVLSAAKKGAEKKGDKKMHSKIKLREKRTAKNTIKQEVKEEESKEAGNGLLVEEDEEMHFRLNSRRFVHEMRAAEVVELITGKYGY